jgi:hypothetical protein
MSSLSDVLSWAAIGCGAAAAALGLVTLAARRARGRPAEPGVASMSWRAVRVGCGVILISCIRWTGGVAGWLLLAGGIWLVVVWDLASWLRARYRLTHLE